MADTWVVDFEDKTELNEVTKNVDNIGGDPRGEYPKPEYFYQSSMNNEEYELKIPSDPTINMANIDISSKSSANLLEASVKVTKSGHALIFDDEGGSERIILRHKDGTGIEMRQDGSMIMRTETNMITSVGGTGVLIIDGDLKVSCKNVELDATGDMDLRVKGDYNVSVDGNKTERIKGTSRKYITGNKSTTTTGNVNNTTVGTVTNTILGNATNIIKGYYNNIIGGTYSMAVKGFSRFTSQTEIAISSGNINMAAADLSIFGAAGTIGGANVTHYGKNYYGTSATFTEGITAVGVTSTSGITATGVTSSGGITAPTFHGDLKGVAELSRSTRSQPYGEAATGSAGAAITDTATAATAATNTAATAQPTTTILTDYLSNSDRGIQKVVIDAGDHIRNKIDLTAATNGITKTELSVKQIRAKLKDDNNAVDPGFLKYLYGREKVNPEFNKKVPTSVGRSFDGSQAYTPFQNMNATPVLIKSQRQPKELLPDSRYNPVFIRQTATWHQQSQSNILSFIDGKTLLGYGIPLSTFLDGPISELDFTTELDKEKRLNLAKQLLLQAEVIKFAKNTPQFAKDYHLAVEEGVYIKGASENLKEGSVPDLAQTGRAIVYAMFKTPGGRATYESIKTDFTASFEFATRLASSLFAYDKIILNYDNIGEFLHAQIIVIMPEVDNDFKFVTNPIMGLETRFNNKILSNTDLVEIAESWSVKTRKEPNATVGSLIYNVVGQTRDKIVKPALEEALSIAAGIAKIDLVTITSGSQPGSDGKRIGSFRHDTGLAADFTLTKDGRLLSAGSVKDQAIMSEFLKAAKTQGILAGGMSKNYMGNNTMHLDMLGVQNHRTSGYDKKTIITWKSDAWFTYAMNN
jgi:hypothetical protein